MKVVVQRSIDASCKVNDNIVGKINKGYLLLVGFTLGDDEKIVDKMANKIINLRIFEDENDKMNLSLNDVNGDILSISQFTLYATLKGRRPSFINALNYDDAKKLYKIFNDKLRSYNIKVEEGIFGADMKISFTNDGPVTIIIDSKEDF